MSKIDCKPIAYYNRPIDSLTRDEFIRALEKLAGVNHDCAVKNMKCRKIILIKNGAEAEAD